MKIYMIENEHNIQGIWTDLNKMLAWISEQTYSCKAISKTDLDVFMERHMVMVFQDGGGHGKHVPWNEIIPQD